MTKKLTKKIIDALSCKGAEAERFYLWDGALPGFGIRTSRSGRKVFVLSYRAHSRKRLLTLGRYGTLTVDQARDLARQRLGEVIGGADPVEERRKAVQGETVEALGSAYTERHSYRKRTGKDDRRRIAQHILPAWKSRKADSIKTCRRSNLAYQDWATCPI